MEIRNNKYLQDCLYNLAHSKWYQEDDPDFEFGMRKCRMCNCQNYEGNMREGICKTCLMDVLDYDTFYGLLTWPVEEYEADLLEDFMLTKWFGIETASKLSESNPRFKEFLKAEYKRLQFEDQAIGNGFADAIKEYISCNSFALDDFAEYLDFESKKYKEMEAIK